MGGRKVTRFIQNGEQYDVVVQVQADNRRTQNETFDIKVRGRNGSMIQLTSLVQAGRKCGAEGAQPLQSVPRRHHHGKSGPGLRIGRGPRNPSEYRGQGAA